MPTMVIPFVRELGSGGLMLFEGTVSVPSGALAMETMSSD